MAWVFLFWLLVGHALADYPLQGEYLALGKARSNKGTPPWQIALSVHALIHAGMVALVTGSVGLGMVEFVFHSLIDFAKCEKWFGLDEKRAYWVDQGLHVACKVAYVIWIAIG